MRISLILGALFLASTGSAFASMDHDIDDSHDHPLLTRYPGSFIRAYAASDFDAYTLIEAGLGDSEETDKAAKREELEGKITRIGYELPDNASPLAAYRSYQNALKQAGFDTLFTCQKLACGESWSSHILVTSGSEDRQYYLAAKRHDDKGDTYVAYYVSQNGEGGFIQAQLDVVEVRPMASDLIKVNRGTTEAGLEQSLKETGKASLYDIYFDTDKALVKPESKPALEQIATLLKRQAALKLYVVGHTDGSGDYQHNLELSRRRAEAVVQQLTQAYGIDAARLNAQGVGPLAPVAENQDESGRQQNRRVELVQQL